MTDKIMNWRESVLKSHEVKWTRPIPKNIDDGKMDIIITLPLTALFEAQAKRSFAAGMDTAMKFFAKYLEGDKPIEVEDLVKFFADSGFPEKAKGLPDAQA